MSFEGLNPIPTDPILGLSAAYAADTRQQKLDLGVGVYKDEVGLTPVMAAVKQAEQTLLTRQNSKVYIPPAGLPGFLQGIQTLLLSENHPVLDDKRICTVQTPGGCGALRLAAELLQSIQPGQKVWVSDPTWANHVPLLQGAGLSIVVYRYYRPETQDLDFEGMQEDLSHAQPGDVVLLHGCCHNPSGVDLSTGQWEQLTEQFLEQGLLPFIDVAYQGLGQGLDSDASGWRNMAARVPEMLVASSCSKNFGLYRERAGAISIIASSEAKATAAQSHLCAIARGIWSMPPAHGPAIVETILLSDELNARWRQELDDMRARIQTLRDQTCQRLQELNWSRDARFISQQKGMFSFLGLSPQQVAVLRETYGIYMVDSSRINIAGLNDAGIEHLCQALIALDA